jgi:pumilio RNA-binding family
MSQNKTKDTKEAELIGQLLSDDMPEVDFKKAAMDFGRSVSAPPPGLIDPFFLENGANDANDTTATREYYEYYHSLKPLDPRLPKPKWKPYLYGGNFNVVDESQESAKNRKISMPEKYNAPNEYLEQYQQLNSQKNPTMSKQYSNDTDSSYSSSTKGNTMGSLQQDSPTTTTNRFQEKPKQDFQYQQQQQNQFTQGQQFYQGGYNKQQNHVQQPMPMQQQPFINKMAMNMNNMMNPMQQPQQNMMYQNYNNMYMQQPQQQQFYPNYNQQYQNNAMNMNMNMGGMQQQQPFYGKGMQAQQPMGYDYNQMNMMYGQQTQQEMYNQYPQQGYTGGYSQPIPQVNRKFPAPTTSNQFYMGNQTNVPQTGGMYKNQPRQQFGNKSTLPQKMDLKQVLPKILEFCQDQNGSRLVQQHFENGTELEREQIFDKIKPSIGTLIGDVFGNYVIQKIIELGTPKMIGTIFESMKGKVIDLSFNTYGCRVVQKVLESKLKDDDILAELKQNVLKCIEDQNGNHVIQKCFETIKTEKLRFIIDEVIGSINELAFHPYGCRVIQRILEYSSAEETAPILKNLMGSIIPLCECQYGNYIMQHLLEKGPEPEKEVLYEAIRKNFIKLSQNKFASNVTEKSVTFGSMEFRRQVLIVLMGKMQDETCALFTLMNHPFGNYVVQRLFEKGDDQLKKKMFQKLQSFELSEIRKNQFGKHVLGFIEKYMEENLANSPNLNAAPSPLINTNIVTNNNKRFNQ